MAVPQGIPLPVPDDGLKAVVLEQERAAWCQPCCPLLERRRLVARVHHAEAIDDQVSACRPRHGHHAAVSEDAEPGATVRATVFCHRSAGGKEASGLDAGHGSGGLQDEGLRLDAFGLFRDRGIFQ